jgi:hypothetical protein
VDLYLFCEGKDDLSFYQPILRQRWSGRGELYAYDCAGKDAVIALMSRVKATLDVEWRGLFFVDKDLDDYCGVQRHVDTYLFETECYSIENYIVGQTPLRIIWTDLLRLSTSDTRLAELLRAYEASYESFVRAMGLITGWIVHLRRSGYKVVLNDICMVNLISLDGDCLCQLKSGWADHILAASNTHSVSYDAAAANTVATELGAYDPKTYIRGKFDLWFFVTFLARALGVLTERVAGQPRTSFSLQISVKTAIDILAPRLVPPQRLSTFLDRVLPP